MLWEQDSLKKGAFFNEDGTPKTEVFKEDLGEYEDQDEPSFPGGLRAMYIYLNQNVVYPEEAKENGWSGRVTLSFVVGKDGKISDVKVVETPQPILANAVVYVVVDQNCCIPFLRCKCQSADCRTLNSYAKNMKIKHLRECV